MDNVNSWQISALNKNIETLNGELVGLKSELSALRERSVTRRELYMSLLLMASFGTIIILLVILYLR